MTLTSARNPLLKDIRRAADRGSLTEAGYCVCEGIHLLEEARRSKCEIGAVIVSEESPVVDATHRLPPALFREIVTTEASQGLIALVRPPVFRMESFGSGPRILLDGIQDPGNAGAIVRAAEAFGAGGVVFLKTTVSPFNPKCLRASAGSLFRVPHIYGIDNETVRAGLSDSQFFVAAAHGGTSIEETEWRAEAAIVIGSEGRGVSLEWSRGATPVRIPTTGVESLNAAVAAAVILYEIKRRKP